MIEYFFFGGVDNVVACGKRGRVTIHNDAVK